MLDARDSTEGITMLLHAEQFIVPCKSILFHKEMDQTVTHEEFWRGTCVINREKFDPKLFFPHSQGTWIGIFMLQNPVTWHWLRPESLQSTALHAGPAIEEKTLFGAEKAWFVFNGRDNMHFTGITRLFDQLCTNEWRKDGDALVVKSS